MRLFGLLVAALAVAGLNPTPGLAQGAEQGRSEESIEPYHKHHDTRHGHDHYYPDRGAIIRDLPKGTIGLNYAGLSYRFSEGVWYESRGPAFMVIAPPIGLVVPSLPPYATALAARGGQTYLYVNSTYYRPRPDLGGYEVVNDPPESVMPLGSEMLVAAQPNVPAVASSQTAQPQAAAAALVAPAPIPVPVPAATSVASTLAAAPATTLAGSVGPTAQIQAQPAPATPLPNAPAGVTPAVTPAVASVPASNSGLAMGAPAVATAPVSMSTTAALPVGVPAGSQSGPSPAAKGPKVFLYPKNGQSADQQARDRYDCYRFAVSQSGLDPMRTGGTNTELQSDFDRAQSACFEARGYASR